METNTTEWEILDVQPWARSRVSLNTMIQTLNTLNNVCPPHIKLMLMHVNTFSSLDSMLERLIDSRKTKTCSTTAILFIADCALQSVFHTNWFNHWYVIVIAPDGHTTIIDSKPPPHVLNPADYGTLMRSQAQQSKHQTLHTGHQTNYDSCGYWAVYYVHQLITQQTTVSELPHVVAHVEDAYDLFASLQTDSKHADM